MTETHTITSQGYRKCRVSRQCGPAARAIAWPIIRREGYTWAEIRSPSRDRDLTKVRHEVMAALFATGIYSMPTIARFLGRTNHTTVLQGIRIHERRARG